MNAKIFSESKRWSNEWWKKELEFPSFKLEKENFFPWDKELEFELLEFTLIW